jgi:hypothetical protein
LEQEQQELKRRNVEKANILAALRQATEEAKIRSCTFRDEKAIESCADEMVGRSQFPAAQGIPSMSTERMCLCFAKHVRRVQRRHVFDAGQDDVRCRI